MIPICPFMHGHGSGSSCPSWRQSPWIKSGDIRFLFYLFPHFFTAFLFAGYAKLANEIRTLFYRMTGKKSAGNLPFLSIFRLLREQSFDTRTMKIVKRANLWGSPAIQASFASTAGPEVLQLIIFSHWSAAGAFPIP
jgi:hypothetical protein